MPNRQDAGSAPPSDPALQTLGFANPPPPPPTAVATLANAPTVSSTPSPGQGIALDSAGKVSASIPFQAVVVTTSDPTSPVIGQCWYRQDTSQFCVRHDAATTKRVTLA